MAKELANVPGVRFPRSGITSECRYSLPASSARVAGDSAHAGRQISFNGQRAGLGHHPWEVQTMGMHSRAVLSVVLFACASAAPATATTITLDALYLGGKNKTAPVI